MTAERGKRHAAIELVLHDVRRQSQGTIVAVERLAVAAKLGKEVGATAVRFGQFRRKRDGAIERCQRILTLSERGQGAAKQCTGARVLWIGGKRLAGALGTFGKAAGAAGNKCQIIMRIGIGRIRAQYSA